MDSIKSFKKKYVKALRDDNAAIFAGAGLSMPSGYVNWKELLREITEELGLDIEKENDLVAIAQYHRNEKGNRANLNQEIISKFTKEFELSKNHEILARLPIKYYWTTNYDKIIEKALTNSNKRIDVKITKDNLSINVPKRDVIIYKMHGDVEHPTEAVITKDDYESYNLTRQLFTTTLQGDLISKTFLFIGFSFDDPNLDYILSRIRILLGESAREHYAIFRKLKEIDFIDKEKYLYAMTKQKLKIDDLKRYSISAVLVDEFEEIEDILIDIEKLFNLNKVFISGSAVKYGSWSEIKANTFMHDLSKSLVEKDYKIVSGFGIGVGGTIINGALEAIFESKYKNSSNYLELRPFPQFKSGKITLHELWEKYRHDMISKSGIAIFLFGNKFNKKKVIQAKGVYREYQIAKELDLSIIPIGSTGYTAKKIFYEISKNIDKYDYLKDYLDVLKNSKDSNLIIKTVLKIITNISKDYLN
ncbi:MAG: SIR2 family protein [Ignavibacteriae bacterium]|nr:SIR2 family protein [Ignavibacteriota bacterium]